MIVRALGWGDIVPGERRALHRHRRLPARHPAGDRHPRQPRRDAGLRRRHRRAGRQGAAHPGHRAHRPRPGRGGLLAEGHRQRGQLLPQHRGQQRLPAGPGDVRAERRPHPRPAAEPELGRLAGQRPARLDRAASSGRRSTPPSPPASSTPARRTPRPSPPPTATSGPRRARSPSPRRACWATTPTPTATP